MTDSSRGEGTGGGKGERGVSLDSHEQTDDLQARFKINLGNGAASAQSGKAPSLIPVPISRPESWEAAQRNSFRPPSQSALAAHCYARSDSRGSKTS